MEDHLKGSRLNLVIRANSVELHDSGAADKSVVHSVKIDKGDVETALRQCYIFINENRDLRTNINFSIPSEQIKFFIKHIDRKDYKDNVNLIAEQFLKNEKNIDISSILYNIVRTGDLIEISVINREQLLEAITFIENIGFKVVSAVGNLNDQKRSFVFDTKLELKGKPKFEAVAPSKILHSGTKFVNSVTSKIFNTNSWIKFRSIRGFSISGLALLATITLALAYFDRSSQKEGLADTNLQIEKAIITKKEKNKTEIEVIKPLNVFLFSQKTNFLPNQDNSEIGLAKRPDETRSQILPAKLKNKPLGNKSIQMQSEDFIYADQSELKINNTNLKIVSHLGTEFLTKSPKGKLSISYNDAINTNDPSINFSSNFVLSSKIIASYSRPDLNLRSPVNEIKIKKLSEVDLDTSTDVSLKNSERIQKTPSSISVATGDLEKKKFDRMMANFQISFDNKLPARPRIRPNKYPFEIKKIPKE